MLAVLFELTAVVATNDLVVLRARLILLRSVLPMRLIILLRIVLHLRRHLFASSSRSVSLMSDAHVPVQDNVGNVPGLRTDRCADFTY